MCIRDSQWNSRAFVNEVQAAYALERLWHLTAGSAGWVGDPAITFRAIEVTDVERMLNAAPGGMEWMPLVGVSPTDWESPLDVEDLPAICRLDSLPGNYSGTTPFPLDLVAGAFILLTRWEEWTRAAPDQLGRHDEGASIAARQGFCDRPVLDEWALVLRLSLIHI